MYIRQPSCLSRSPSCSIKASLPPSPLLLYVRLSVLVIIWWNRCPHRLESWLFSPFSSRSSVSALLFVLHISRSIWKTNLYGIQVLIYRTRDFSIGYRYTVVSKPTCGSTFQTCTFVTQNWRSNKVDMIFSMRNRCEMIINIIFELTMIILDVLCRSGWVD